MFLLRKYSALLHQHPLATKSITGGFMFSLADVIVQNHQIRQSKLKGDLSAKYNFKRTAISATMGTVFMMPLFHYWFSYVLPGMVAKCNKIINLRLPIPKNAPPIVTIFSSMAIDQTIWAFGISCYYFMVMNLLEHQSIDKGVDMIKNNIYDTMIMNWKIWPAAQMLNFWLIPIEYRVLWVNLVGLVWQVYLIQVQHQD